MKLKIRESDGAGKTLATLASPAAGLEEGDDAEGGDAASAARQHALVLASPAEVEPLAALFPRSGDGSLERGPRFRRLLTAVDAVPGLEGAAAPPQITPDDAADARRVPPVPGLRVRFRPVGWGTAPPPALLPPSAAAGGGGKKKEKAAKAAAAAAAAAAADAAAEEAAALEAKRERKAARKEKKRRKGSEADDQGA